MVCDLPGRHFSLRMSPRSSLRHVRPCPGLGHRERVASRERFGQRLVEVCILIGLFCALALAFLFMGTPPVRHSTINRKLPSAGGIIPPFLSCENAHFTISKSALWTRLRSAYARCSFQGRPQSLLSFPWVL